ncbi:MAG: malate dehydrogenase [Opitutales bacterium]|nr:malate dehydrogenase [Opitutales bacterium]MBQ2722163.1 malate dehydrogenase [Opitutales bacterium]
MKKPIKITVTGSTGHIGYSLLFKIANGEMFGKDQPVDLTMLGVYPGAGAMRVGLAMELEDCAYPQLNSMRSTTDLDDGFKDANWIIMLGCAPRKKGMERADLLEMNGRMFIGQGASIARSASDDVRVIVVGNPCNTNAWIAMNNAEGVPTDRWFALTRLDENRAKAQLARKAGVHVSDVSQMCVWGNHSNTQFPDFYNAKICGKPALDVIGDEEWLKNDFVRIVRNRGSAVIEERGASSAASAASAIVDTVHSIINPTPEGDFHSIGVCSDGSYGTKKGLITSMPIRSDGKNIEIVQGLQISDFARTQIDASVNELQEEADTFNGLAF